MKIKKLWTKLFAPRYETEAIALHVAGATVQHRNPFEYIEVQRTMMSCPWSLLESGLGRFI